MTESENFLSRWSRRKQEAQGDPAVQSEAPDAVLTVEAGAEPLSAEAKPQNAGDQEPPFDLSTLPPIESIGVGTDIKLFLQKGVPLELARAALRRAWTSDPAIRDFIEVAENQWDFATGQGLPGFGPLEATDDVRRMVAELFQGRTSPPAEIEAGQHGAPGLKEDEPDQRDLVLNEGEAAVSDSTEADPTADEALARLDDSEHEMLRRNETDIAVQQEPKQLDSHLPLPRAHGRALPQ